MLCTCTVLVFSVNTSTSTYRVVYLCIIICVDTGTVCTRIPNTHVPVEFFDLVFEQKKGCVFFKITFVLLNYLFYL